MALGVRQAAHRAGQSRRGLCLLALALACLPLAACKTPKILCFKSSGLGAIAVTSSLTSNQRRPTRIDLVFVTDKKVYDSISKMKARDYFAAREQLGRDFPKGYLPQQWELQAGQSLTLTPTGAPCNLVGTLLFVNYRGEGEFRQKIGKEKRGVLVLGDKNFEWNPGS